MALFRKFGINVNDNHNANRVDNLLRLKLKSRSFLNGSVALMCFGLSGDVSITITCEAWRTIVADCKIFKA